MFERNAKTKQRTKEVIMKKHFFSFIFCLISMLIFGSCFSFPTRDSETFTFDESLSEYALIHYKHGTSHTFNGKAGLAIIEYNGMKVNWEPPAFGSIGLKIPGGNTTFIFDGRSGDRYGYTVYDNIPFVFNFENGKEYTLEVGRNYIYIYNGTSSSSRDLISFDMSKGQKLAWEYGKNYE
jgi:hypothetical protein